MPTRVIHKIPVKEAKDRNKAMKIASKMNGVIEVKIGGDEKDTVTVIGEALDAYKLTKLLKNEFGSATTFLSDEITQKPDDKCKLPCIIGQPSCCLNPPPYYYNYNTCSNPDSCSIQ